MGFNNDYRSIPRHEESLCTARLVRNSMDKLVLMKYAEFLQRNEKVRIAQLF